MSYGYENVTLNRNVIVGERITPDDIEQPPATCSICERDIYRERERLPPYGLVMVGGTPKHVCAHCIYELNDYLCEHLKLFGMLNSGRFFPPLITKALGKKKV